jgi:hypothetical protein
MQVTGENFLKWQMNYILLTKQSKFMPVVDVDVSGQTKPWISFKAYTEPLT